MNNKSALELDANVAALLGYIIGIIAIISLFLEKDNKFVRFHAVQSLLYHALYLVVFIVLGIFTGVLAFVSGTLAGLFSMLTFLLWLGFFAGLIYLAFKAFKGETVKIPVIGDMADKWAN